MRKRIFLIATLLLMATTFCHARSLTLDEADTIIVILLVVVALFLVLGGIILHHNKVVRRRNEQLLRILNALDDYRVIMGHREHSFDEQEKAIVKKQPKPKVAKVVQLDEEHAFFVKMDARVNKEMPFTNPDFDQQSLVEFMEVDLDTFCKLVPRYKDPERTLEYINSLRAEYAAKILMEHPDYSMDDIARMCGFTNTASFNSVFRFAFGITPTNYLNGVRQMFKKKAT
jgi:AraC-like DNA-binding protein